MTSFYFRLLLIAVKTTGILILFQKMEGSAGVRAEVYVPGQ